MSGVATYEAVTSGPSAQPQPVVKATATAQAVPHVDVVHWAGSLTLKAGGGLLLDGDPPHYDYREANPDVAMGAATRGQVTDSVALWSSGGILTSRQCRDTVISSGGGIIDIHPGDKVRALSLNGRPAILTVKSIAHDYGPTAFDVTIWVKP
ncbi:hypothetical protein GCM10009839_87480 [Catenulispora yoronensis]|uniref:Uncharacterized protein n=2 Tax=Catenulispora yoronensis TaxID=450799 RepID=A0ABP5H3D5_9ACTN